MLLGRRFCSILHRPTLSSSAFADRNVHIFVHSSAFVTSNEVEVVHEDTSFVLPLYASYTGPHTYTDLCISDISHAKTAEFYEFRLVSDNSTIFVV